MSRKQSKCPKCESKSIARIAFGYPSQKMFEASERGEIVLGGCCVTEDDPKWHCKECENER